MLASVADHVGMGGAPDVALRFGQPDQLLDDPEPRAIADHVRMAGELEDAAFLIGRLELAPEHIEHIRGRRVGTQVLEAMHHEIDRVVADPFHRQFDHAGRLAVEQQLVAIDIGHQRGIVEQAGFLGDAQRVRREIPGRGARADRPHLGGLLQHVGCAHDQILLGLIGKHRVQFVDPRMDADLVAFGDDAPLLVRIEQRTHGRHIEGRRHRVFREQFQDARDADTIAVLSPRHAPDRLAAVAQLIGLVVGIERQRERAARAALPALGPIGLAGADLVDQPAPVLFRPLPGFEF